MNKNYCQNMNHRRSNSPVRICPSCGEVVNASIAAKKCSEEDHAAKRRRQCKYCVDCGMLLIGC
jgi:hypothetical protein